MDLTSEVFIITLRVALAGAVVWIVLRWSSSAGRGVLPVLRRLVSLLVVMVLAVLNVLAPINAQFGWYSSAGEVWNDLAGGPVRMVPASAAVGGQAAAAVAASPGPSPLAALPTDGRDATPLSLTPTAHGGHQTFTVTGAASGMTGEVTVWVPPEYESDPSATFPVVEAFHGFLPAPLAFFSAFHIDEAVKTLTARKTIRPPVIVIPNWSPDRVDNECVDGGPGKPAAETWLTRDIPAWVYTHFRVESSRDAWATLGASAGGFCSLAATMLNPRTYATGIVFGGYANPDFAPSYVPFAKDSERGRRYDLIARAAANPPPVALWTLTSLPDPESAKPTAALAAAARAPLSITPTVLPTGSHRADVWEPYFPTALAWLARTSPAFAPA